MFFRTFPGDWFMMPAMIDFWQQQCEPRCVYMVTVIKWFSDTLLYNFLTKSRIMLKSIPSFALLHDISYFIKLHKIQIIFILEYILTEILSILKVTKPVKVAQSHWLRLYHTCIYLDGQQLENIKLFACFFAVVASFLDSSHFLQ
jgi:hypothetical protein